MRRIIHISILVTLTMIISFVLAWIYERDLLILIIDIFQRYNSKMLAMHPGSVLFPQEDLILSITITFSFIPIAMYGFYKSGNIMTLFLIYAAFAIIAVVIYFLHMYISAFTNDYLFIEDLPFIRAGIFSSFGVLVLGVICTLFYKPSANKTLQPTAEGGG